METSYPSCVQRSNARLNEIIAAVGFCNRYRVVTPQAGIPSISPHRRGFLKLPPDKSKAACWLASAENSFV